MQFEDCSPPTIPSLEQRQDALRKGLGRAVQWALAGELDEHSLLQTCLEDQRYDTQIDQLRGDWLWQMIHALDAADRFHAPLLQQLNKLTDERNAYQLCQLAYHYAHAGNDAFRKRLYQLVESKPFAESCLGEEEIVRLDGAVGFLFAAQVRGQRLASTDWEWHDESLIFNASEILGAEHISSILGTSSDSDIARFYKCWKEEEKSKTDRKHVDYAPQSLSASPQEVFEAAQGESQCYWFRRWGMHASDPDLRMVLDFLWSTGDEQVLARLLRVFSNRPLPEFDHRMILFCMYNDEEVRRRAFAALSKNSHPAVREFALTQLDIRANDDVISLFINNFSAGDEARILEAMALGDDFCENHNVLSDIINILEKNLSARCNELAVIAYACTPCALCRHSAARLLLEHQAAPDWLKKEIQYDCDEASQKLFV